MKQSANYFSNTACEFFPCHKNADSKNFNCLFCYYPLYRLPDCGGNYELLSNGIKDCTNCKFPHENYWAVVDKLRKEVKS